jgi:hypothetical protein
VLSSVTKRVEPERVFNLEVATDHEYYAGPAAVLAHNTALCGNVGTGGRGQLIETLRAKLAKDLGFSDSGARIIVDESVEIANPKAVQALREAGLNVRSVTELFGQRGIKDTPIRELAESLDAQVLALDRGRDALTGGGFGSRAIPVDARATSAGSLIRFITGE